MSGDQCDFRSGHEETRGRMGVFSEAWGEAPRFFFIHNSYNRGSITLRMPTLLATITTRLVTFSGWGISISAFTCNECFQKSFSPLDHCKKPMNFRWSWPWSFLLSALVFIFDPSFPTIFDGLSKLVRLEVKDGWQSFSSRTATDQD